MTTLKALQDALVTFLAGQGVEAFSAWPGRERFRHTRPVAVIQMKEVEGGPAGFQNYLGETYDSQAGTWTEHYGQQVTVRFILRLYSPEKKGEEGCRMLLDQIVAAFQQGGPDGLRMEKWSMGEAGFDTASGMFLGKLQATCRGLLTARTDACGTFLGFEVKGGVTL